MVPLANLVNFRNVAGPDRVPRYNLLPDGRGERLDAGRASAPARR